MKEMSTMEKKKGGMGSLMARANMEITGSKGMTSVTTSTSTSTSTSEDGPVAGPSPGPGPSLRSESCSSSIGQPDDDTDDDEEEEVQSTLSSLASLEDSLPFNRKGLSKFYGGKSKSYGNLGEVRSLEDLGKSDNPFNKRRRTLMAYNLMFKDNHHISNASTSHKHHKSIGIGSTTTMSHNNGKAALFYAHSNHISMPLLPLAEDHDDNDNDDHYNDNGVDDDYCVAPTPTSFLPPPPPVIATTPAATPTPTPTSSHHSNSNSNSHTSLDIYAPLNL